MAASQHRSPLAPDHRISRDEIRSLLRSLLVEIGKIGEEVVTDESSLDGDLRLDSVLLIAIQSALQDQLDIEIDPVEIVDRNRFDAIVEYIVEQACSK